MFFGLTRDDHMFCDCSLKYAATASGDPGVAIPGSRFKADKLHDRFQPNISPSGTPVSTILSSVRLMRGFQRQIQEAVRMPAGSSVCIISGNRTTRTRHITEIPWFGA